jgi:hypothetical protein
VKYNDLEEEIINTTASAMFGLPGRESYRTGTHPKPRTLGIGWLLYAFVRAMRPKTILEIGSGGSTCCLLWGVRHNEMGHVYTCDPHPSGIPDEQHRPTDFEKDADGVTLNHHHAIMVRTIRKWGMDDIYTHYHEPSTTLLPRWDKPIDMLVVDGDHCKAALQNDIQFAKFIVPGGYGMFHDFTACVFEVGETITDMVGGSDEWSLIVEPNCLSMAIFQRKWSLSPKECWTAAFLASAENPNGMDTPFQMTDPRACGAVKKWNGRWFPEMNHFHDSQPEGIEVAKKVIDWEKRTGKTLENMEDLVA